MGLRERLRRLEGEAQKANAPTFDEYWAAARRGTARRLQGAYERLALLPSLNGSSTPITGREDREDGLLSDDTPERDEADRRTVEAWEGANGAPDMAGAADEARARLLSMRIL